jgi:hypothetical protein
LFAKKVQWLFLDSSLCTKFGAKSTFLWCLKGARPQLSADSTPMSFLCPTWREL